MTMRLFARIRGQCAVGGALSTVLLIGLLSACGSSSSSFPTASAKLGSLKISGAYIPKPASPDVAAAYFSVKNSGAADTLLSVGSNVSKSVGLHQTIEKGSVGVMVGVPSLPIPQNGSLKLAPGGYHVMLMNPSTLTVGMHVTLTLHFAHAGSMSLQVPVVPLTSGDDDSGSMGNMKMN